MGLFTKNEERSIKGVVEELLKNKNITPREQDKFKRASFVDIVNLSSELLDIDEEKKYYPAAVAFCPRVMTKIYEKAPNFFANAGINTNIIRYEHPKKNVSSEMMTSEEKKKFIETKVEINSFLDNMIRKSVNSKQISKDLDILGKATTIEDNILRETHQQIGKSRLDAYRYSFGKNKDSEHIVLLRVFDDDGVTPIAVEPARLLLDAGLIVINYERGEKIMTAKTAELLPNCGERIKHLRDKFGTEINTLSDKTKIDKKRLEKYENSEQEVSYTDAKVLQDYFSKEMGGPPNTASLLRENNHLSMFYRDFPSGLPTAQTQATGVQFHKLLHFVDFENWDNAFNEMDIYMGERKRESPVVTYDSLKNV